MQNVLRAIHFEIFENMAEEKRLRAIHDFDSGNSNIRNDADISACMKIDAVLNRLEKVVLKRM